VVKLVGANIADRTGHSFAEEKKTSVESVILIPGALGRMESYGPMGSWRLCSPQSVGLTEWRSSYLEHLIRPSKSQMEMLDKLQIASAAAKKIIASSAWDRPGADGRGERPSTL
jgi:hypothetical protein